MIFLFSAVCVMCSAGTSETSGENGGTDWCEAVSEEDYGKLK